ncbi:MAG: hypothetical protein K0Q49_248 [Haloplasmataceae bacterium]|jgi:hypothetical protein|nr:hypothetical protein [Haloplasmataceae bacterium]
MEFLINKSLHSDLDNFFTVQLIFGQRKKIMVWFTIIYR